MWVSKGFVIDTARCRCDRGGGISRLYPLRPRHSESVPTHLFTLRTRFTDPDQYLDFARWVDGFGDQVAKAAMIDHHADIINLKGSSDRLKDTGMDTLPSARAEDAAP